MSLSSFGDECVKLTLTSTWLKCPNFFAASAVTYSYQVHRSLQCTVHMAERSYYLFIYLISFELKCSGGKEWLLNHSPPCQAFYVINSLLVWCGCCWSGFESHCHTPLEQHSLTQGVVLFPQPPMRNLSVSGFIFKGKISRAPDDDAVVSSQDRWSCNALFQRKLLLLSECVCVWEERDKVVCVCVCSWERWSVYTHTTCVCVCVYCSPCLLLFHFSCGQDVTFNHRLPVCLKWILFGKQLIGEIGTGRIGLEREAAHVAP